MVASPKKQVAKNEEATPVKKQKIDHAKASTINNEALVEYLRSLASVRETCHRVYGLAKEDKLPNFKVVQDKIPEVADYIIKIIRQGYPKNEAGVPFHSRWRHFETGNPDRVPHVHDHLF